MLKIKPWSMKDEIRKRVNKEADIKYWDKLVLPPLPKFIPPQVVKDSAAVSNFINNILHELRP